MKLRYATTCRRLRLRSHVDCAVFYLKCRLRPRAPIFFLRWGGQALCRCVRAVREQCGCIVTEASGRRCMTIARVVTFSTEKEYEEFKLPLYRISSALFPLFFSHVATATLLHHKTKNHSKVCDPSVKKYWGTGPAVRRLLDQSPFNIY